MCANPFAYGKSISVCICVLAGSYVLVCNLYKSLCLTAMTKWVSPLLPSGATLPSPSPAVWPRLRSGQLKSRPVCSENIKQRAWLQRWAQNNSLCPSSHPKFPAAIYICIRLKILHFSEFLVSGSDAETKDIRFAFFLQSSSICCVHFPKHILYIPQAKSKLHEI